MSKDIKKSFKLDDNTESVEIDFLLDYEEISRDNENSKEYQTILYLPFLTKSSWTKTPSSKNNPDKLQERAISIIESALKRKYQDIKIRDYNNQQRFKKFKEIVGTIDDVEKEYSNGLHHKGPNEKIGSKSVSEIWDELEKCKKVSKISEIQSEYSLDLSWKQFVSIILSKYCSYCGISILNIYDLAKSKQLFTKRSRGYCLEVDQIDPYGNYTDNNCTASCYWCNNAKTDEFSVTDFKEIAKGINAVWKKRGADIVDFNEEDDIWSQYVNK